MVASREEWLRNAVAGTRVAHLGFADVGCERTKRMADAWLHEKLHQTAATLVGLDVVPEFVVAATDAGYEAVLVDCTVSDAVAALRLPPFDIVLLGELIEHVDNPGGLIRAAGILLKPTGRLIITTPNARRPIDVAFAALGRESIHPDHVALYSPRTLSTLLERHGWKIEEILVYANPAPGIPASGLKERVLRGFAMLQRQLARVAPYCGDGLIVTARRMGAAGPGDDSSGET